ncbi:hypothetical protein ACFJGX_26035 [Hydrogenophaga sp. UC242_50]|uniref:hypothetical protein n=1 Tax=Hydrogenophaga sp. UC242_50 TaxID=3350169 RepID=UPI0036D25779
MRQPQDPQHGDAAHQREDVVLRRKARQESREQREQRDRQAQDDALLREPVLEAAPAHGGAAGG